MSTCDTAVEMLHVAVRAAFNVVSAWADRIPLSQYRTISLCPAAGLARRRADFFALGIKMPPGMCAGCRTWRLSHVDQEAWSGLLLINNM